MSQDIQCPIDRQLEIFGVIHKSIQNWGRVKGLVNTMRTILEQHFLQNVDFFKKYAHFEKQLKQFQRHKLPSQRWSVGDKILLFWTVIYVQAIFRGDPNSSQLKQVIINREFIRISEEEWELVSEILHVGIKEIKYKWVLFIKQNKGQKFSCIDVPFTNNKIQRQVDSIILERYDGLKNFKQLSVLIYEKTGIVKTPKQLKERQDIIDPQNLKTKWTADEEICLLNNISSKGTKWTYITNNFKTKRSYNNIKNHYHLICRRYCKEHGIKNIIHKNINIKDIIQWRIEKPDVMKVDHRYLQTPIPNINPFQNIDNYDISQ